MKFLISLLLIVLSACSKYPIVRIGVVHDHVWRNAERLCVEQGSSLHYVVTNSKIYSLESIKDDEDYPCSDDYVFRCQNGRDIKYNSGTTHCFIQEYQLEESLNVEQY